MIFHFNHVFFFFFPFPAFYGVIFKENEEAAFSNFYFWSSLGFSIAYAYSDILCTNTKIYILLALLLVSIAFYIKVELYFTCKNSKRKLEVENTNSNEEENKKPLTMEEEIKFHQSGAISWSNMQHWFSSFYKRWCVQPGRWSRHDETSRKYFIVNLWTIRFFEIKIFPLKEEIKCHKSNGVISRLNMQHLFSSFYAR